MSKRIVSLLLSLALCLSLLPTAAFAATWADTHNNHPICGASCTDGGNHTDVTFGTKIWMDGNTLKKGSEEWRTTDYSGTNYYVLDNGNYYLGNAISLGNSIRIAENATVTLCLNGHSITGAAGEDVITVRNDVTFTLTDCNGSRNGNGKITHESGDGGGVYVISKGTFHMYGGSITGNKATYGGGGVYVISKGTFHMYGGSITGNTAMNGGGVHVNDGKFNMEGGTIGGTGNDANTASNGGGVYVYYGTFHMYGGSIIGNRATNNGGGVCVDSDSAFEMSGSASITGNSANSDGCGGVYMHNANSSITVSGAVKITGNCNGGGASNVYLPNDKTITIGDVHLSDNASIGVTTATTPTTGNSVTIATGANNDDVTHFSADAGADYHFTLDGSEVKLVNGTAVATYTVSFDANGGTGTMADVTDVSGNYTLPANGFTAPTGKQFKGWATSTGGAVISGTTINVTSNTTLYAIWETIPVTTYTVSFDANGGTASETSKQTGADGKLTSLPNASRSSYTFDGWYTTASSGTQITTTYVFSADTTVYAHWTYSGGSSSSSGGSSRPAYTVTAPAKTDNGAVSTNMKSAKQGDTVTVTVTPDKGYVLETLTVLDKNGKELKLTDKGDGKYTFTMPAGKVEVKASFMEDNTMLNYFVDVKPGDFFYDAVLWAAKTGITKGINDTEFGPSQSCTRAQIVTFLWRAAGSPVVNYAMSMDDVNESSYYAEAVRWALSEGITGGVGGGRFAPNAICTRAQAAAFLYRAAGSPAVSGGSAFSDVAASAYYADAVAWAEQNGVTEGVGGGLFGSGNDCTRAQIVTFLFRAYQGK